MSTSSEGKIVDVVIIEPLYPVNLGIIARTVKNFNMGKLALVNPTAEVVEKATFYSARGYDLLSRADAYSSLADLRDRYDILVGTSAKESAKPSLIRDFITPKELAGIVRKYDKVAIVFGREDIGLKNSELEFMDINVKIPACDSYPTLNLAVSVGIILYEVYSSRSALRRFKAASWNERLLLISTISNLFKYLGLGSELIGKSERTLQNILARSASSGKEVMVMQAAFNKATVLLKRLRSEVD